MKINKKELEKKGFIIIKKAISNPKEQLKKLKLDPRVHSRIMWSLRIQLKKYFEHLWNDKNLVCSFDGNWIGKGEEIPWHIDQNKSHGKGLICVQGVLALKQSNVTELLEGSHKYFESLSNRCTDNLSYVWESYPILDDDYIWKKGLDKISPILEPGDFLLFDSRIAHKVNYCSDRAVIYVSMIPRKRLLNIVERNRIKAFLKGWQTTHWCERLVWRNYSGPERQSIPKSFLNLI